MDCLFCKIISGEVPSYTIYEDDIVIVFLDINPNVNGHMLIAPKKHYTDINDIDNDIIIHMLEICRKMYALLIKTFKAEGVTLVQNNGCSQDIKHFHMHIIPRCSEDKKLEPTYVNPNKMPLEAVKNMLIKNI